MSATGATFRCRVGTLTLICDLGDRYRNTFYDPDRLTARSVDPARHLEQVAWTLVGSLAAFPGSGPHRCDP